MTYIISTDKGFKLLKELPEEPKIACLDRHLTKKQKLICIDPRKHGCLCAEYDEAVQQAIDSAPFIKNTEAAHTIVQQCTTGTILYNHPYQVDLSGYDVTATCQHNGIHNSTCVYNHVTLTPKAVENKQESEWRTVTRLADLLPKSESENSEATENSAQVESQVERIMNAVHKSLQWKGGEITGIEVEKLEQKINGILEPRDSKTVSEEGGKETRESSRINGIARSLIKDFIATIRKEVKRFDVINPDERNLWIERYIDNFESSLSPLPSETQQEVMVEFYRDMKTLVNQDNWTPSEAARELMKHYSVTAFLTPKGDQPNKK